MYLFRNPYRYKLGISSRPQFCSRPRNSDHKIWIENFSPYSVEVDWTTRDTESLRLFLSSSEIFYLEGPIVRAYRNFYQASLYVKHT